EERELTEEVPRSERVQQHPGPGGGVHRDLHHSAAHHVERRARVAAPEDAGPGGKLPGPHRRRKRGALRRVEALEQRDIGEQRVIGGHGLLQGSGRGEVFPFLDRRAVVPLPAAGVAGYRRGVFSAVRRPRAKTKLAASAVSMPSAPAPSTPCDSEPPTIASSSGAVAGADAAGGLEGRGRAARGSAASAGRARRAGRRMKWRTEASGSRLRTTPHPGWTAPAVGS